MAKHNGSLATALREQILAAPLRRERVAVPEWNCDVDVLEPTAADREKFQSGLVEFGPDGKPRRVTANLVQAKLLVRCLRSTEGLRVFGDEDAQSLADCSGAVVDRLADVALRLGGMKTGDDEDAKKNSEPTPVAG